MSKIGVGQPSNWSSGWTPRRSARCRRKAGASTGRTARVAGSRAKMGVVSLDIVWPSWTTPSTIGVCRAALAATAASVSLVTVSHCGCSTPPHFLVSGGYAVAPKSMRTAVGLPSSALLLAAATQQASAAGRGRIRVPSSLSNLLPLAGQPAGATPKRR